MAKDRTGEDVQQDVALSPPTCRCKGTGWLTGADADNPRPCPEHRKVRPPRPVREYFEPEPSEAAAKAIEAFELAEEAAWAERARADVESPVTLGKETRE